VSGKLRCPFPGCTGEFEDKADSPDLLICPEPACRRLSVRCDRTQGGDRCRALNRPLARFCRLCRQLLPSDAVSAAWLREQGLETLDSGRGVDVLGPDLVASLEGKVRTNASSRVMLEMGEAAGRIWIGAGDGTFSLVEPFATGQPPIMERNLWPGRGNLRVRAISSAIWLLIYCEHGVEVLDLLQFDDQKHGIHRTTPTKLWSSQGEQRLVAEPVLLPCHRGAADSVEGLDRVAIWVTAGSGGLFLRTAHLSIARKGEPIVEVMQLDSPAPEPGERPELLSVPVGIVNEAVLCLPRDIVRIALRAMADGGSQRVEAKCHSLPGSVEIVQRRQGRFVTGALERGGVAFVPSSPSARSSGDSAGSLWVAVQFPDSGAREILYRIGYGDAADMHPVQDSGLPLGVETFSGNGRVLCFTGNSLRLYNALGQITMRAESPHLAGLRRATIAGRIAVCSGQNISSGQSRWFTVLANLVGSPSLFGLNISDDPLPHPVVLGSYLFSIERNPQASADASYGKNGAYRLVGRPLGTRG